jgi:putative ABC transport system substrate-binding protein
MNDEQAERIARLLEEIRDGQRLQLERQAQALQRQDELLAQQRERLAGLSKRSEQADQLLAKSAKVVAGARILALVALPFVVLLAIFLAWALLAHNAPTKSVQASSGAVAKAADPPGAGPQAAGAASQGRVPRVAILVFGTKDAVSATAPSAAPGLVRARLTELGYVDGKSILVQEAYADGDLQRLSQLARDVVATKPDVIVAIAAAATLAARQATSTIPIVMAHAGNPVGAGLAESLSHPGGNVTGTTSMVPDLGVKQVELLRELLPRLVTLGVLANPTNPGAGASIANVNEAAHRLKLHVVVGEVTRAQDFDKAFRIIRDARPDGLLVMIEPLIGLHRQQILEFAAANRLPASYDVGREFVRSGGLISYGPVLYTHYAIAADYVDKILKGANPGDLPIHQPTQFVLAVNLKTARDLGLTIPQSLLVRADEVIQ